MKKLALIAAVVFTTYTLESCRQPDEVLSPAEAATLKRVQDSTNKDNDTHNIQSSENGIEPSGVTTIEADGEIIPPPRK